MHHPTLKMQCRYLVECFDKSGNLKWQEQIINLIPNAGLNEILDKFWKGSGYTAAFYVGLVSATPTIAAGDTMASHAGWTEVQTYDEVTRSALVLGAVASQSVSNTASKAVFTISGTVTVGGAFITTNATKGGTTGILMSAAAFTAGNRALVDDDVINVTATITAANP